MASVQQPAQRAWMLPLAASNTTKPLAIALATYPIQEALVSFLTPDDLITLTLTSQTLHGHIRMDDANARANLLSKTMCPGTGHYLRLSRHCPCPAKSFTLAISCARFGYATESRPCVECGVNTCNECRIHVVYNPLTEDSGFDERRWWAGFYFLQPTAISVHPPKNSDNSAWYLPIEKMEPLHDQGRIHIPLNIAAIGDPEPLQRILDLDLGTHQSIDPLGRTQYPYSGHQIVSLLNMIVSKRKDLACPSCYQERQKVSVRCSCTLRKRFLDRWLCATCYIKEDNADGDLRCRVPVADDVGEGHRHVCGCEAEFTPQVRPKVMCNWCKGEIQGLQQGDSEDISTEQGEDEGDGDDEAEEEEHIDEDHSAAEIANLPQDEFGFAKNHDDSLSVYVNGERIRGERLGRSMVRQWMTMQGEPVECICCVCNNLNPHHAHADDEGLDEEDEGYDNGGWDNTDEAMDDDDSYEAHLPDQEEVESAAGFEDQWGLD